MKWAYPNLLFKEETMKKVLFLSLLLVFALNIKANELKLDYLTGDKKLACEALLCLASPTKPSECNPSLARYFGIKLKKPGDTINARRNFLKQCPASSEVPDSEMERYVNEIAPNVDEECSIYALNHKIERTILRKERVCTRENGSYSCKEVNIYGYRTNANLTKSCSLLASSKYTDYRLKYTCNKEFYEEQDFRNGYTKEEITKAVFDSLPDSEKLALQVKKYPNLSGNKALMIVKYYKKKPIKKDCWINETK